MLLSNNQIDAQTVVSFDLFDHSVIKFVYNYFYAAYGGHQTTLQLLIDN